MLRGRLSYATGHYSCTVHVQAIVEDYSCTAVQLQLVGGWGPGGGLGLLGSGPHQLLFYLDSFLTFLLFGGLCSLQAPV